MTKSTEKDENAFVTEQPLPSGTGFAEGAASGLEFSECTENGCGDKKTARKATSRLKEGVLVGVFGMVLNVLLGGFKLLAGMLTGSVSIVSDGVNNLADAGNSLVTVSGFALSSRGADKEHPYGHGRYEYIASLIIGIIIIVVGAEFLKTSIDKLIDPVLPSVSAFAFTVLGLSIGVKLFMGIFYSVKAAKIKSTTLKAAAVDSFSDCMITAVVIAGAVGGRYTDFNVDGVMGLVVSAVIAVSGIKILFETVSKLLGSAKNDSYVKKLEEIIRRDKQIVGMHDLKIHDYGAAKTIASVHAEFDHNITIAAAHAVIDAAEHEAYREMGIELCIHVDLIDTSDELKNRVRHAIKDILRFYGAGLHDLQLDDDGDEARFHVKLPKKHIKCQKELAKSLTDAVRDITGFSLVSIEFDIEY